MHANKKKDKIKLNNTTNIFRLYNFMFSFAWIRKYRVLCGGATVSPGVTSTSKNMSYIAPTTP